MPQKRKSKLVAMKEIEEECKKQAEEAFGRTVKTALEQRGYTLARYLDGELDEEESNEVREMIMNPSASRDVIAWTCETMEDGSLPDLVIKNSNGDYVAGIETTTTATIEFCDKGLEQELEQFAQEWENERPNLRQNLDANFAEHMRVVRLDGSEQFSLTVTIIEV